MNKYIIDTNIFEWLSDQRHPHHIPCKRQLASLNDDDIVYIPITTIYEIQYSIANFQQDSEDVKKKVQLALNSFVDIFTIANLSVSGAIIFGELKSKYKTTFGSTKESIKKHNFDLLLASISIDHSAILVSNDVIFERIRSLDLGFKAIDWTVS